MKDAITDVSGIKVGHYSGKEAAVGCTVTLCDEDVVATVVRVVGEAEALADVPAAKGCEAWKK